MKFRYYSENLPGNLHTAVLYIDSAHPEWDVVTLSTTGFNTVIVYRLPIEESVEAPKSSGEIDVAIKAAFHRAQSAPALKLSNYTAEQVAELNEAMIEIYTLLKPFVSTQ